MFTQLEKYLVYALTHYESVYIPNIGLFKVELCHAEAHPVRHEFCPPKTKLTFTQCELDCTPTVEQLAKDTKIETIVAKKLLDDYSVFLQKKLSQNNSYSIESIGVLTIDSSNKITFKENSDKIFNSDFFGLQQFNANISKKEKIETISLPKKKKHIFRKTLLAITSIIIIGCLIAYFAFPNESKLVIDKIKNTIGICEEKTDSISPIKTDSVVQDSTIIPIDTIAIDTIASDTIIANIEPISSNSFFIVCACFKDITLAENHIERLKAKGYNATICGQTSKGLHVVAYEGYANKQDANISMKTIMVKENRTDLWIFHKNQ